MTPNDKEKNFFSKDDLRSLTILEKLPDKALQWLADRGIRLELASGDRMFSRGDPAHYMFIVVKGSIQRYEEVGGQWLVVSTTSRGQVTGSLPFSRMTNYPGHAVAAGPTQILRVNKSDFNELLTVSHELGQRLVAEMSNRVRGDVRLEQQREKMIALGRLSAGLAHELNNPAAAIRRNAENLSERITELSAINIKIAEKKLDQTAVAAIEKLKQIAGGQRPAEYLSPLARSDREEELVSWFKNQNVTDAWALASTFTDTGLSVEDFEQFTNSISKEICSDALAMVAGSVEIDRMISEISKSAARISELVTSVKTYSHMDRSTEHKSTDIREGLDNTLTMLGHRIKEKNIKLTREYQDDLPTVPGNAGELNQVWTNLIDNAIDAMKNEGNLGIMIESDSWGVIVRITDDGGGIPGEILHRIFDPFFTTKGVGEGTGLGLDIARRIVHTHGGQIEVQSDTKGTEFYVRLPIGNDKRVG